MEAKELKRQREYRKRTGNSSTRRYEKTPNGFLMRAYRNMESRVKGIQYKKAHLYKNLPLLSRNDFYTWSLLNYRFIQLYWEWVNNSYDQKLTPSINRIDTKKGYTLNNIEWITHSENSRLGSFNRHKKVVS